MDPAPFADDRRCHTLDTSHMRKRIDYTISLTLFLSIFFLLFENIYLPLFRKLSFYPTYFFQKQKFPHFYSFISFILSLDVKKVITPSTPFTLRTRFRELGRLITPNC